jgi:serine/threonine-protein kinase
MAPEQARGEIDQLDERCNVFGLGSILCVILTGLPPYWSGSRGEVQARAARGDLGDALARLEACGADEELVRLARQCLAAEKAGRPRRAAEVAQALGAYLAGVQERLREAEQERALAEARARTRRLARWLLLGLGAALLVVVLEGGSVAWLGLQSYRAELARRRQADEETMLVVKRGNDLLEAGWQANDLARLQEAMAEADGAAARARRDAVSAEVRRQVAALQADVAARLEQAEKNRALLDALLDVSASREAPLFGKDESGGTAALVQPGVDEQYADAFGRWGADVDVMSETEAVARFREQPEAVRQEVVAGLDAWMLERQRLKRPLASWRRLYGVAEHLDPSDLRRRMRAVLVGEQLLTEDDAEALDRVNVPTDPVPTVVLLAEARASWGDAAAAERVLRQAVAARPDQAMLLDRLGKLMERQGPSRLAEAIECYRAARALRPRLGVALARALGGAGRAADAEAVLRDLLRQQPRNPDLLVDLGMTVCRQGRVREAADALGKGRDLMPAGDPERDAAGRLLRSWQRWALLEARLPAVLRGTEQPDARERVAFGKLCALKKLYAASARCYRDALAPGSRRADDVPSPERYDAACAAALAGCGRGADAARTDADERARWRRQALDWLRAELTCRGKTRGAAGMAPTLRHWQTDPDLGGVRDPDALALLPEAEHQEWQQLWADVAALRRRVEAGP